MSPVFVARRGKSDGHKSSFRPHRRLPWRPSGDRGFGKDITESEKIFFAPGNLSYPEHEGVYGIDPDFSRDKEQVAAGEDAQFSVTFVAPAAEIQDPFWTINGQHAAAWPGQWAAD